jgi:cytochrome P450
MSLRCLRCEPRCYTGRHNLEGSYPFTPECRALLDKSLFFQGAIYGTDPPLHTRFRTLVGQYFSPRRLDRLKPFILDTARELAAGLVASDGGDLVAEFASALSLRVTCHMIGIPSADQATVSEWNGSWLALRVAPHPGAAGEWRASADLVRSLPS